jgi:dihydroneopterin aldolase
MKDGAEDRIRIEQLKIFARVGVVKTEREKSQRLSASITIWPRRQGGDLCDDVRNTVNYSDVCEETKRFVQKRSDKLIETLAEAIAEHLLRKFAIRRIAVELRKFVLKDAAYASVTVTRAAALN